METKTDRQERIPHFEQASICNAKVMVVGAGASGNEVLKNLALIGFRYIFVADFDDISTSNLSRTVLFRADDVGKRKSATAAERFLEMNIEDTAKADSFDGDLCQKIGEGVIRHMDLVIGCMDNEQTRLYLSNICQLLNKPYIDTGIGGFNWNVFAASGSADCACYACTLSPRQERAALNRVRNSCDVTRRKAAQAGHIPTIGISAGSAACLAVQEAVKIVHHQKNPDSHLCPPRFGWMSHFTAEENRLQNIFFPVRKSCPHHDNYEAHGGVQETLISAHWKLKDALAWVRTQYGRDYAIALYKDCVCAERSFVTTAYCKHCGEPIEVYRPQPLQDEDLLCAKCRGKQPVQLSNAILKSLFDSSDEERLQELTLLELGIPLMHIVEFSPRDGNGESLYLELTGDREEVLPNLPE